MKVGTQASCIMLHPSVFICPTFNGKYALTENIVQEIELSVPDEI